MTLLDTFDDRLLEFFSEDQLAQLIEDGADEIIWEEGRVLLRVNSQASTNSVYRVTASFCDFTYRTHISSDDMWRDEDGALCMCWYPYFR